MTDSVTVARAGKRDRLVEAARDLFHRNGVERTTLADIAKESDVPLGNVYYYFRTKDDFVRAVIDAHADQIRELFRILDRHRSPRARLIAFTREIAQSGPVVASHGCPLGTLCSELGRRGDDLSDAAATLMRLRVEWASEQFRLMGRKDATNLGITLVSTIQGAALLANSYRDPAVLTGQTRYLQRWINDLA
jgi:TetR/AcrR family transcriptional repressor of nem operon